MCGLFASVGVAPDPARIDIVAHRGPDGRGWVTFESSAGPVALGHRRLAIIDVSNAGLQPMADPSGRYHLIFNGEIYNYVELRQLMRASGEVFRTESDSEVLLRAWMIWGDELLSRLRGMFAFVIWDNSKKRIFAARDRFGIKPLYMVKSANAVALASEIKQLIGLPGSTGRMNVPRVQDFLADGITDHTGETLFEGILQLRGGECVSIDAGKSQPQIEVKRWYDVTPGHVELTEAAAADCFEGLLTEAVKLHLRSDVAIGSCLSGGLDSSSIVCLASKLLPSGSSFATVSACYPDHMSVNEKPFMDAVVRHAGTKPYFVNPKAEDLIAAASNITWHQDEPFGSTSIFAQWCVFAEAKRVALKVMLDGQGADEQLAGYHFAFPMHMASLARQGQVAEFVRVMRERRMLHGSSKSAQFKRMAASLLPRYAVAAVRRQHRKFAEHDWLGSSIIQSRGNPKTAMRTATELLGLNEPRDIKELCTVMTHASNLQMLLHWEDRNSMAHSIEARVPFLDHPLVEFSLALGNHHKLCGATTKRVLRLAMANTLPKVVADRSDKLGFATPEEKWLRLPLREFILSSVNATLSRYPGLLNAAGTRALVLEMLDGRRPVSPVVWRIANLGIWGERFAISL